MTEDQRSVPQLQIDYPMPWVFQVIPGIQNGMARIVAVDRNQQEVPLNVLMRLISVVTTRLATQQPTPPQP